MPCLPFLRASLAPSLALTLCGPVMAQFSETGGVELTEFSAIADEGAANDRGTAVAVNGSIAYVAASATSASGGRWTISAHAVADGSALWSVQLFEGPGDATDAPRDLLVSADGAVLYVAGAMAPASPTDGDAAVFALDASDGAVLWSSFFDEVGGQGNDDSVTSIALAPDGTTLALTGYVDRGPINNGERMHVALLDTADGTAIWEHRIDGTFGNKHDRGVDVAFAPDGSRVFAAGTLYAGGSEVFGTFAFDASTGVELWSHLYSEPFETESEVSGIATNGSQVLVTGLHRRVTPEVELDGTVALAAATGDVLWTGSGPASVGAQRSYFAEPLGAEFLLLEAVATASVDHDALRLARIDGATGQRQWETDYDLFGFPFGALFPRQLVHDPSTGMAAVLGARTLNQILPSAYLEAFTIVYDTASGAELWNEVTAPAETFDDDLTAGAFAGDRLIAVGESFLFTEGDDLRLDARRSSDGQTLFELLIDTQTTAATFAGAAVLEPESGDLFLLGNQKASTKTAAHAVRVDGDDATAQWTFTDQPGTVTGGNFAAGSLNPDGTALFLAGCDGRDWLVCALDAQSGALLWRRTIDGPAALIDEALDVLVAADGERVFVTGAVDAPLGSDPDGAEAARTIAFDAATGADLWDARHDPTPQDEYGHRLAMVADGSRLVVVGQREPNVFKSLIELVAYDPTSGVVDWVRTVSGGQTQGVAWDSAATAARCLPNDGGLGLLGSTVDPLTGDGFAALWIVDPVDGALVATAKVAQPDADFVARTGAFTDDGALAVVAGESRIQDAHMAAGFDVEGRTPLWIRDYPLESAASIHSLALAPDGRTAYAGGRSSDTDFATRGIDTLSGASIWESHFELAGVPDFTPQLRGAEAVAYDAQRRRVWTIGSGPLVGTDTDALVLRQSDPTLLGDYANFFIPAGGQQDLTVRAGLEHAGRIYALLGTTSGTAPGLAVDGQLLPLNFDSYTLYTLQNPNAATLPRSFGVLDATGGATPAFVLPLGLGPVLDDTDFHHAYVVIDLAPSGPAVVHASNAIGVSIFD